MSVSSLTHHRFVVHHFSETLFHFLRLPFLFLIFASLVSQFDHAGWGEGDSKVSSPTMMDSIGLLQFLKESRVGNRSLLDFFPMVTSWYCPAPTPTPSPIKETSPLAYTGLLGPLNIVYDGCSNHELLDCRSKPKIEIGLPPWSDEGSILEPFVGQAVMVTTVQETCGWGIGGQRLFGPVAVSVVPIIEDPCSGVQECPNSTQGMGVYEGWLSEQHVVYDGCSYYQIRDCSGTLLACVGETVWREFQDFELKYVRVETEKGVCGYGIGGQPLEGEVIRDISLISPEYLPFEDPELFYYYFDAKVALTPLADRVGIVLRSGTDQSDRDQFLEDHPWLGGFIDEASPPSGLLRLNLKLEAGWSVMRMLLGILSQDHRVSYVTPVFEAAGHPDPGPMLTDTFIVKFNADVTDEQIDALNEANDVEIIESGRPAHRHGRFLLKPKLLHNALEVLRLANLYNENDLTEYSTPNFANNGWLD